MVLALIIRDCQSTGWQALGYHTLDLYEWRRPARQKVHFSRYPTPPLRKHPESHHNDDNTGSRAETSPCLRATRGTKRTYVTGNLPIPHPKHNCRNRALQHNVQANFSEFWSSSLPIRAIRSCGIEAVSHLAPHLEQLHMLALWGSLWVTAMPGVAT